MQCHTPHTNTHAREQCSPACSNSGIPGGGDQQVNVIQSNSFISLMKVITAWRERESATLAKNIYLLSAFKASKPAWAGWHGEKNYF